MWTMMPREQLLELPRVSRTTRTNRTNRRLRQSHGRVTLCLVHALAFIPTHAWVASTPRHGGQRVAARGSVLQSSNDDWNDDGATPRNATVTVPFTALDDPTLRLQRTAAHLQKLQRRQGTDAASRFTDASSAPDPLGDERERLVQLYVQQPASELKRLLKSRDMALKGRKPDLARRLAVDDLQAQYGDLDHGKEWNDDTEYDTEYDLDDTVEPLRKQAVRQPLPVSSFAGLTLSPTAAAALGRAQFRHPSSIQARAIPWIVGTRGVSGQSCLLHAATGSGKTLAYLLPLTERLWRDANADRYALIVTPTRELAAQVAGIASVLAPPGTVRLVSRPMDLTARLPVERMQFVSGHAATDDNVQPRIFVGSATALYHSLYGDGKLPASPTSKPEAMYMLQNTMYLVLDEVDRLLNVVGGGTSASPGRERGTTKKVKASRDATDNAIPPEMPAAILTAAVLRLTLGKATVVAASATVGRPLKRELARCMGLTPQECPVTLRDDDATDPPVAPPVTTIPTAAPNMASTRASVTTRAVTIPETVRHFVVPVVDGTSPGKILTSAFAAIQSLYPTQPRMLLVLTRKFGITIPNTIGALKHFKCQPEPVSLLDALEADGTNAMMEVHRQVTGATGVGASSLPDGNNQGYLFVTSEDSVRGLHLDGLNVVLVAGRPAGPDEYTHIAGRTGRAGLSGCVVNIVSDLDAGKLGAWEKMLGIEYIECDSPKRLGAVVAETEPAT